LNFDQFAEGVKGVVESIAPTLDPDEDWMPVMQIADGEGDVSVFGFDPAFMNSEARKDALAQRLMVPAIDGFGGKLLATVFTCWMAHYDAPDENGNFNGPRPSEREDRIEVLIVTVMDSNKVVAYAAQIERHENSHPTLKAWDTWENQLGGRFVEPLQTALRDSDGRPREGFAEKFGEAFGA
jgi:hypothetical protein